MVAVLTSKSKETEVGIAASLEPLEEVDDPRMEWSVLLSILLMT